MVLNSEQIEECVNFDNDEILCFLRQFLIEVVLGSLTTRAKNWIFVNISYWIFVNIY